MVKTRQSNTTFYIDHDGVHRYVISDEPCTDQESLGEDTEEEEEEEEVVSVPETDQDEDSDEELHISPPITTKSKPPGFMRRRGGHQFVTARKGSSASRSKTSASDTKTKTKPRQKDPSESETSPVSSELNSTKAKRRQDAANKMKTAVKDKKKPATSKGDHNKSSKQNKKRPVQDDEPSSEDDDDENEVDENGMTEHQLKNVTKAILADKNFANMVLAKAQDGNGLKLAISPSTLLLRRPPNFSSGTPSSLATRRNSDNGWETPPWMPLSWKISTITKVKARNKLPKWRQTVTSSLMSGVVSWLVP